MLRIQIISIDCNGSHLNLMEAPLQLFAALNNQQINPEHGVTNNYSNTERGVTNNYSNPECGVTKYETRKHYE